MATRIEVRCRADDAPYVCRITDTSRFEMRLSAAQRRELAALADETGLTSADLARLGIRWLLAHRDVLTGRSLAGEQRAARA
jgi:hypothetical protein